MWFGARSRLLAWTTLLMALTVVPPALAAPIANPVATFTGLDKITARITNFDVYINETVQFGSLQITPRVCYTRSANETQQRTSVFVEVDRVSLKGTTERVFTGWMFADSPALNAVDDAVYDFWLVDCKQHSNVPPPTVTNAETPPPQPPADAAPSTAASSAPPPSAPRDQPTDQVQVKDGSIITLVRPPQAGGDGSTGQ